MNNKTALIIGASGLVGSHCLSALLATKYYGKVIALSRTLLDISHEKLDQGFIDFDNLKEYSHLINAHDVFCTLGTTIRKAGSQAAFEKVDHTYPVDIAKIAFANGTQQFLIVTALGANQLSRVFYNRVKGNVEEDIAAIPFQGTHIFRPSFLVGNRKEERTGEKIGTMAATLLSPLLMFGLKKYRAIKAEAVAGAMVTIARQNINGVHTYESDEIQEIYKEGIRTWND